MLTIELVAHMDAGDRRLWQGDQDERPLSDLGRRQSERMAAALAGAGAIDALYSSPALRCQETLAPLLRRFALATEVLADLRETDDFLPPDALRDGPMQEPMGGALDDLDRAYSEAAADATFAVQLHSAFHPSGG